MKQSPAGRDWDFWPCTEQKQLARPIAQHGTLHDGVALLVIIHAYIPYKKKPFFCVRKERKTNRFDVWCHTGVDIVARWFDPTRLDLDGERKKESRWQRQTEYRVQYVHIFPEFRSPPFSLVVICFYYTWYCVLFILFEAPHRWNDMMG